jgi:hypothetical protein
MLGFQCALRNKLIRHTFDADSINSKDGPRGLETSFEQLKLWSDFNGKNYTLSFFIQRENQSGTHLEYPVECFDSEPRVHLNNPRLVRLYFRLPPELPKGSRGSTSSIASFGVVNNIQQRLSFPKSQPAFSEMSQSPSPSRKRFSRKRNSSDDSTPPSGPISTSQTRCKDSPTHSYRIWRTNIT